MKRLISLVALSLLLTLGMAPSASQAAANRSRDQLVGAWHLLWLEEPGADGKVHKADCTGLLVYTADGHMSVQVMYRNPQMAQAGPVQYSTGGYEASYGRYEINDAHTFYFPRRRRAGSDARRQGLETRI